MPDLRKIIGETPDAEWVLRDSLSDYARLQELEESGEYADRMIAVIADRVIAALISDEAVEAARRAHATEGQFFGCYSTAAMSTAIQAAAKAIRGEQHA